jgi:SAM-dependent methyltransferase
MTMDIERTNTITLSILEEATSYHRWIFEKVKPYLKGNILEVGCGTGNLTGWLLGWGKVVVSDMNEDYLRLVEEKYQDHSNLKGVFIWDIQQEPTKELLASFDTIVCSNVLEHIGDDVSVLKHFHHLLSGEGRLILLVPALKCLYNQLDKDLGHFRRYSKKELVSKIEQSGFRVLHLTYFNPFGILGWFFNGSILRRNLLPQNQVKIFNRMVPLFLSLEKIIPNWVGQSLIVVGEKR